MFLAYLNPLIDTIHVPKQSQKGSMYTSTVVLDLCTALGTVPYGGVVFAFPWDLYTRQLGPHFLLQHLLI